MIGVSDTTQLSYQELQYQTGFCGIRNHGPLPMHRANVLLASICRILGTTQIKIFTVSTEYIGAPPEILISLSGTGQLGCEYEKPVLRQAD